METKQLLLGRNVSGEAAGRISQLSGVTVGTNTASDFQWLQDTALATQATLSPLPVGNMVSTTVSLYSASQVLDFVAALSAEGH